METEKGKEEIGMILIQPTAVEPIQKSNTIIQIGEELDKITDHNLNVEFKVPETPLFVAQNQSSTPQIDLNTLFQRPNFQEVDHASESDRLTPEMLSTIRITGQFAVKSSTFEGQENVWELSNLVQRGSKKTCEDFKDGVVFATKQYYVHIPNRLWKGNYFTFWDGFKNFFISLFHIPKLLFGFPQSYYSTPNISKERVRISKLLDELTQTSYQNAESYFAQQSEFRTLGKIFDFLSLFKLTFKVDDMRIVIHNFKFIRDTLSRPYDDLKKKWNLNSPDRRKELAERLSVNFSDTQELAQEVRDEEEKMFQEEIFKLIHTTLPTEEAASVVSLMNSLAIIREALYSHEKRKRNAISIFQKELIEKHSILGKIPEWVNDKTNSFTERYDKKYPFSVENLSKKLEGAERYLFEKNMKIIDDVDQTYKDSRVKHPKREWYVLRVDSFIAALR